MNLQAFLIVVVAVAITSIYAVSIDHDKVQFIAQPEAVTESEKAAVKFKPRLKIHDGCVSFPAVNAAGETSGGLKGTKYDSGCSTAPLGSQVYGRAAWHNDVWAIMYTWYFPKGFWRHFATRRHDWASVVVWIDNPAVETPKLLGLSMSLGDGMYERTAPAYGFNCQITTTTFKHDLGAHWWYYGPPYMDFVDCADKDGEFQDLIMWEQLPDEARTALDTTDFGNGKVPITDAEFTGRLEKAWPF